MRFKPAFLDYTDSDSSGVFNTMLNYSQLWRGKLLYLLVVALVPFLNLAAFNFVVTRSNAEQEIQLRTIRLASNTKRSISFFIEERKAFLHYIVRSNSFEQISDQAQLNAILNSLKKTVGGITEIQILDATGRQIQHAAFDGQVALEYPTEDWLAQVAAGKEYISDVFAGHQGRPYFTIAMKHEIDSHSFYILRATLEMDRINHHLSHLELQGNGDAFLINFDGVIQTSSRSHGNVLDKITWPVPGFSERTEVLESTDGKGQKIVVGYAYIPDTPFILMITKEKNLLMESWRKTQELLFIFVFLTVVVVLVVVYWVATYLVHQIYLADLKRVQTLHEAEQSSKLASIGRLAAGVAHEINNPLAIINEKAGLIKDIFSYREEYKHDTKIIGLVDSILTSVERCGGITKRLLGFARHLDVSIQNVDIERVIEDVLSFLVKEAEYRSISVNVDVQEKIPEFQADRGKLQQILLNLVNNAFAAMKENGRLDIKVWRVDKDFVGVKVKDDGCGIPKTDLQKIFEPFYSTKTKTGGTGLGLSITYGLVQELKGRLSVVSELGKGTEFTIVLPLANTEKKGGAT